MIAYARVSRRPATRVARRVAVGVGGNDGSGSGDVITSQSQLFALMTAEGENQTRFNAYLTATAQTQQDLVDGNITESGLITWWTANP